MRIEEVLNAAGLNFGGQPIPGNRITLFCTRGHASRAHLTEAIEDGPKTHHLCPQCQAVALTIIPFRDASFDQIVAGQRLGGDRWIVLGQYSLDVPGPNEPV